MGLSRLNNFLKSVRGNIIYVDPNSLDATDSIENQGNSLTRPFRTIQRALAEAARFSYQRGLDNDRFAKTTILLYPGDHYIDNRPGFIPESTNNYYVRNGSQTNNFPSWSTTTNFNLTTANNALYKLNSIYGGVIVPRGTSIVGMDLRKTKIRPLYVPNPVDDTIERSAIFRVTGACYFWQFSILDADPNSTCYRDYTNTIFVPNFSHHKLTAFEYADGVNAVSIDDTYLTYSTTRTDLDMYYEKIGLAYGQSSGREIQPDYPSNALDIQPKIDEYRIVGSRGAEVGIASVKSGDGIIPTTKITVTLEENFDELDVDTPVVIQGINADGYDGQYVVAEILSSNQIVYNVQNPPLDPAPNTIGATLSISVDTVTSASPYVFNCSLRSVYGLCGLHADGNKATGFKSMVLAQFTGIGLQKDNNAFVKYNLSSGSYEDTNAPGNENIQSDSLSRFKPEYENYHVKCSNDAYLQVVSVFAIGFAYHFYSDSGGDQSINNSNSNFGSCSLFAKGFRKDSFPRDDVGYITHVIPPKVIDNSEISIEFASIDVGVTTSIGISSHLYLYDETNASSPPSEVIEGYRVGARSNDKLYLSISQLGITSEYSASIVMKDTQSTISQKSYTVGRLTGINSITNNTAILTTNHNFTNGETIRIFSDTGQLPDGIDPNQIYYAITDTLPANQIKIAKTFNDALSGSEIGINSKGGILNIISRVSDKKSGDIGHPLQFDTSASQWYLNVDASNTIYTQLATLGVNKLGTATNRSYIKRIKDSRNINDLLYRFRYVIPSTSSVESRPPLEGYVIQESNSSLAGSNTEIGYQFNPSIVNLINSAQIRNPRIISDIIWSSQLVTVTTEIPHDLNVGSKVEILNVSSTNNTSATKNKGFNGTFTVTQVLDSRQFTYNVKNNPGTFTNNVSSRTTSLPYFKRKNFNDIYYIYKVDEIQKYVFGQQDGIYNLLIANSSNSPVLSPFTGRKFSQPLQYLYPQLDRDNPKSDPKSAKSFANSSIIGKIDINDPQNSITRETLDKKIKDLNVGIGITNIVSSTGIAHTIYTEIDHKLNRITSLSITSPGAGYGDGTATIQNYYDAKLTRGVLNDVLATARVTVSTAGTISDVKIIDGGSNYNVGDTVNVVGIASTTGYNPAVLTVTSVYNNIGDGILIKDIDETTYNQYNTLYQITGISNNKSITVSSSSTITSALISPSGIGNTSTQNSRAILCGPVLNVSSLVYNNTSGIATVTTLQNHGLSQDNIIKLGGANSQLYNGDFIVKQVVGLTTFIVSIGSSVSSPSTSGSILVYRPYFVASGGDSTLENENITGRQFANYAGITTTLSASITDPNATVISVTNTSKLDLNVGDFLSIDDEIVRIQTTVTSDNIVVFRGVLGTRKTTHVSGSVIRRIKPIPVEFRRNSIIRASAHTFEYTGFGPGNYSTAFPEKQDRTLSAREEILSQSTKESGGVIVYSGLNADGDYYTGNKIINSITGKENVYDVPVINYVGEEINFGNLDSGYNVIDAEELVVSRSLTVGGGQKSNIISKFNGPVILNEKLTSTSNKGIEANSLYLQGDALISKKYTVVNTEPTESGNPGDVSYNSNPASGGNVGWIYTNNNRWEKFGKIGINGLDPIFGIGVSNGGSTVGIASVLNFVGTAITVSTEFDSVTGISTIRLIGLSPQLNQIGVSTSVNNNFVGLATLINFVGYGITVSSEYSPSGIATITFTGGPGVGGTGSPGGSSNQIQFNNAGFFGGVSGFEYNGTSLSLSGSTSADLFKVTQNGSGNAFVVEDQSSDTTPFVITGDGSIGIGSANPTAKLDIFSTTTESIRIKSTSGSGNIVRIDNTFGDTTPTIFDINGNVGINTVAASAPLDVRGNVHIQNSLRIYESDRTNYIDLQVPSIGSNLTFTLPDQVGIASNILSTSGSGVLTWTTNSNIVSSVLPNTGSLTEGSNLYFTNERAQDAIGIAITAGTQTGITVTYDDANNKIDFSVSTSELVPPFTTRGFNIPI